MNRDEIRDRAFAYVMRHDMLKAHERVVAGISGGADSMCLLGLLLEWRKTLDLHITVLHVNHGIRGAAADEDESFVRQFCAEHEVDFRAVHANVPKLAEESGTTEEEAGRNLRYRVFLETARELECTKIAVAHNRSDNAETVIFNMLRGSGISGLKGITPVRKLCEGIDVIRPLLSTSRSEIEVYLAACNMTFRTDSTNFDTGYSRNAIRNIVMPVFRDQINSASEEHIVRLAAQAYEIEEYLAVETENRLRALIESGALKKIGTGRREDAIDRTVCGAGKTGITGFEDFPGTTGFRISVEALAGSAPLIRGMIIRRLIGELAGRLKDIANVHTEDVLGLKEKQSGRRLSLPYGITAYREFGDIVLERNASEAEKASGSTDSGLNSTCVMDWDSKDTGLKNGCTKNTDSKENGTSIADLDVTELNKFTEILPFEIGIPCPDMPEGAVLKLFVTDSCPKDDFTKNLCTKFFDCDKITDSVLIRTRRPGDYLLLRGPDGDLMHKSLKTWLTDNRIPAKERDRLVLITEGSHVLWIVGYRRDDSCLLDNDTKSVLVVKLECDGDSARQ